MYNITMFSTEDELLELTGLKDFTELIDKGFNLDDWDVGFCCDEPLHYCDDAYWLMERMENYCVGYHYVRYNDKNYYTVHHT